MKPAADPIRRKAALRRAGEAAWLLPLVAVSLFCIVSRLNESGAGFNDGALARAEPAPIAAMRHLFPATNPGLDDAIARASGKPEDLKRAVVFFRGWMRTRTDDMLRAPDAALLAVASARLHVLLAARAEDPALCLQYARAPAGGLASPRHPPSQLLALAVDDELVRQVSAARAGVDAPVTRPDTPKVWALPSVKHSASWVTLQTLRNSPRLTRLSTARRCTAYVDAYRLALALPAQDGARVAAALLASTSSNASESGAPADERA